MNIRITGRNMDLTPQLRELIEKKVSRLKKYFGRIQETNVILELIKYRHEVEIIVRADLITVQGHGESAELRTALDSAVNKVEKQIRRQKEKLYRNKKHQKRPRIRT